MIWLALMKVPFFNAKIVEFPRKTYMVMCIFKSFFKNISASSYTNDYYL
jgi:hypothetical protein